MKIAGYCRVSTQEQAEHGWNPAADRELIRERCPEGSDLELFSDDGRQGDDPNRPGLLALLSRLDEFDVVIMRQQDRISRDPVIWGTAAAAFQKHGVRVETFTGPIDLDTPQGRFMADMMAAVGKLEKGQIAQRVRQAKAQRAKAGGHPGGRRPFGYVFADTGRKGAHDRVIYELQPDLMEVAVVNRMFEMAEATSQRKIAHLLNAEGIRTSTGSLWTQSSVARVLGNVLYLGKIRRKVNGKWEVHEGQHRAVVDEALWHRVNGFRSAPERRAGGRPMTSLHLCTRGLLRCGSCGSGMLPYALTGRAPVYRCGGRHHHGTDFCDQPPIRRELVDEALLSELTKRYLDVDGARERLRARQAAELPLAEAAVAEAERELAKAEARIARVDRGWQDGVISDAKYRRQSHQLEEELAGAQQAVRQAESRVLAIHADGATTDAEEALLQHLAYLKALVSGAVDQARDVEALRMVLRQLFASIELCGPSNPFGQGADGVLIPEGNDPMAGQYRLLLRLRSEMVDLERFEPRKAPVPEPTPPPYRTGHFLADALFAPILVRT